MKTKLHYFTIILAILLLCLTDSVWAQNPPNPSVPTAILVNSFPHTEYNVNSNGGGTAIGMNGTCSQILCCSTLVYRVETPVYGSLRVENSNIQPLTGSIIAYTPDIPEPLDYSDLTYISAVGNFCGFRDSMQLGRNYDWGNQYWYGNPDINDPSQVLPPGTYYLLLWNHNQQTGQGAVSDFTFQFVDFCPDGGDTIYVDKSANGNNDGSSFVNAYASLHDALDNGDGCDQVWVAKGTYIPTEEADGTTDSSRDFIFSIPDGLTLYGGFAGTETELGQRVNYGSGEANETILSGDINGDDDGTTSTTWDNTYAVVSSTTNLNDITITGSNPAKRIFVKGDAGGTNDGSSWTNAYTSLQSALDAAVSDDEIWVAKGTYYPTEETDGTTDNSRRYSFQMIDGVAIYGGFAGTESATSERTDYGYGGTNETILSGDYNDDDVISGSGATLSISGNSENTYHIFDHPSGYILSSSAILDGFTLKGGNANGGSNPDNDGGAMYNQSGQSPTINNCYFIGNRVSDNGGAYMGANGANSTISNCTFTLNYATDAGGAFTNYNSDPTITNCLFYGNRGNTEKGGAIYNYGPSNGTGGSNPSIVNSTVTENASTSGGGIYNTYNSDITIINSIVYGNTISTGVGTQIRNYDDSDLTLSYSDIEGGIAGGIYSSSGGSTIDGGNNIDADPLFVGSTLNVNHPYSIFGISPCTDVGDNSACTETYDIRGSDYGRKLDKDDGTSGTIDIGAYEYKYNTDKLFPGYFVDIDASGSNDGSSWTNAFTSFQSALDAASSGDYIWVAEGTYKPSSAYDLTNTSRYYHFRMIEGVEIYGGFAGTEVLPSERTDYGVGGANETILSGDIGTVGNNSDNTYHVFYHPDGIGLTSSAVLDGFTITGGNANGSTIHYEGGGMRNVNSSPYIENSSFTSNYGGEGGVVYNDNSSPNFENCDLSNNNGGQGGVVFNWGSSPEFTNCNLSNNSALGSVSMNKFSSTPSYTNCLFSNNSSSTAHYFNGSSGTFINCTLADNSSGSDGSALYVTNSSSNPATIIKNTIIWGTTTTNIYLAAGNSIEYYNSNIEGSGGSSSWDAGIGTDGGSNIDSDPKFVGSDFNPNHPYSIYGVSPCADVGDNTANSEDYDIRGSDYSRKLNKADGAAGTIDMGAYEYKYNTDPYSGPIYVDDDKSGDGSSWANAYASFQSALNEVASGQEIWVAKGTYKPSSAYDLTNTSRYYHFRMINGVTIYGGFAGTETDASERTDYGSGGANETILSGDIGTIDDSSDNCYHIFYHPAGLNLDATAVLNGFTITKGNADGSNPHNSGAGMYNYESSPSISNCTFLSNSTSGYGGGMYNYSNSSTSIDNCTFTDNTAIFGGGMGNYGSSPSISNSTFTDNSASGGYVHYGGGLYSRNSSYTLTNSIFSGNSSETYGGGIYNRGAGSPSITNCIITGSTGPGGQGLYNTEGATPNVKNTIIWHNSSYEVYNSSSTPTFSYCDIEGSGGSSSWNTDLGTDGGSNIDSDPHFADAGGNDFLLTSYSPCADAGDNTPNSETYDIRGSGYDRKLNKTNGASGTIDMGAYEFKFGTDPTYALTSWTGTSGTAWSTEGSWSGKDVPTMYYNITIPNVANDPVISSTSTASSNNLTIENGATLSIQSDASGVGSLITNGTVTNNGEVSIQRYVSESVWHFISVPNNVTTANTFDGDYLQSWDETTATWTDMTETTTVLTPVKGYSFWGTPSKAASYTFSGTPNSGNQSLAVTYTEVVGYGNDGANLLGNPYPSSIDWSGLDDTWGAVYYWNGTQYATWNDGSATNGGVQYIPPMQGFFITVSESETFNLTNDNRTHEGASAYFKATEELPANSILLEAKSGSLKDELFIRLDNDAAEAFELQRDAYKFPSNTEGLSQIYSFTGEKMLSIDVRPETEVIQLGFQNDENGIYSIVIKDIADLSGVKLEDTKTGTYHDLQSGSYEFAWRITDNEKRFKLHLNALGIEDDIVQQNQILIYSSGQTIYIKNERSTKNVQIRISDITGRIVLEKNIQSSGLIAIPTNLKSGIYIVSVMNENKIETEKIIIN